MSKNQNKSQEMFDGLVTNAVDFLRHSLEELEKKPKYSVINFCASIELFLKARLIAEHWSLIIEMPEKANITKFIKGEFKSVGMDATIDRLQNIAEVKISQSANSSFTKLREHRNKLIHFFHPTYVEEVESELIQNIVIEQCRSWFYLHQLLTEKWKEIFSNYLTDIENLHQLMRNRQGFLQEKFESLRAGIEKGKEKGIIFSLCESCGCESSKTTLINEPLFSAECLVCEISFLVLKERCPKCDHTIEIRDLGEGECEKCGARIDLDYLLEKYAPSNYLGHGMYEENRAYCTECFLIFEASVVPFEKQWLCLSCLFLHDLIDQCEWCSENVTGDVENTYLSGCLLCEGRLGQLDD